MQIVKFKTGVLFSGYGFKLPGHSYECSNISKVKCDHCAHVCYLARWVFLRFAYVPAEVLLKSMKL